MWSFCLSCDSKSVSFLVFGVMDRSGGDVDLRFGGDVDLLCSASIDSTEWIPGLDNKRWTMGFKFAAGAGW